MFLFGPVISDCPFQSYVASRCYAMFVTLRGKGIRVANACRKPPDNISLSGDAPERGLKAAK